MIFDESKIKDVKRGELMGTVFLAVAAAGVIFFAVCYPLARARSSDALLYLSFALPPALMLAGAAGAALCNLTYGARAEKLISDYVLAVCLENPQAMHPERDSLTFRIYRSGCIFTMNANGYKDGLTFDFSAFKRLNAARRAAITTAICNRLTVSFCRLYERGAKYADVGYVIDGKNKSVAIISGGVPDKKAFKIYLKNKRN